MAQTPFTITPGQGFVAGAVVLVVVLVVVVEVVVEAAVVVVGRIVVVVVAAVVVVVVLAFVVVVEPVVVVELEPDVDVEVVDVTGTDEPSLDGTHNRSHGATCHCIPWRRVTSATLTWKHNSSDGPLTAGDTPDGTQRRDGFSRRTDIRLLIVSAAGDWNRAEAADGYRTDAHVYCAAAVLVFWACARENEIAAAMPQVAASRCSTSATGVGPFAPAGLNWSRP